MKETRKCATMIKTHVARHVRVAMTMEMLTHRLMKSAIPSSHFSQQVMLTKQYQDVWIIHVKCAAITNLRRCIRQQERMTFVTKMCTVAHRGSYEWTHHWLVAFRLPSVDHLDSAKDFSSTPHIMDCQHIWGRNVVQQSMTELSMQYCLYWRFALFTKCQNG